MPPDAPLDADQVHHLDAEAGRGGAARASRLRFLLLVAGLIAVAAVGAWVVVADPFSDPAAAEAPPPAADNLLGEAWSFESSEHSSPSAAWFVPADAPAGFAFPAEAAVSGAVGASAIANESGWSRMFSNVLVQLDGGALEIGATSKGAHVQLLLRFEASGKLPYDVVVASGEGSLTGSCAVPPEYTSARAGMGCVGAGRLDDVFLRRVPAVSSAPSVSQGVYDVTLLAGGVLAIMRDGDLALRLGPASVRPAEGRALPGVAAQLPGASSLALPDGTRVGFSVELDNVSEAGPSGRTTDRPALRTRATGLPTGATLLLQGVLVGPLARAPVGVRSGGRFDRFTDDFQAEGVDMLVLGRTQDRLVLDMGAPFDLVATSLDENTISLVIERKAAGSLDQQLVIRAGFQEERIVAASLLEEASASEARGAFGSALTLLERIVSEFPYDEQVLEQAASSSARLRVAADERLQALRADLDDAVVLGAPDRWRDVKAAAAAAYGRWRDHGNVAPAFAAFLDEVDRLAGPVLSEVDGRRRSALEARLESFREDGRFPSVVAEMEEALAVQSAGAGGQNP